MISWRWGSLAGAGLLAASACSSSPTVNEPGGSLTPPPGTGGSAAAGGSAGDGSGGGGRLGTGGGLTLSGGSAGVSGGSGGTTAGDPCASKDCGVGQRCDASSGTATCVDKTCDELACSASELCTSAEGGGHVCTPKCTSDAACSEELHCDVASGECLPDDCTPDSRMCGTADTVRVCGSNGSPGEPITCKSAGYYASTCTADQAGSGACTCEDDWDCPPFMTCDAGICTGTGVAPTCTLPAAAFKDVLPQVEFRWGEGTTHYYYQEANRDPAPDPTVDDAAGKAFKWSSQVVSPPLVINLDDDNGDGKADERDFP
ncbi:MAG TPA: hypothetical protein VGQ57_03670, partial [Polyangiaceae bacterium]|nr:hypothetical protein [Polyangiaceae bacterium]